LNGTKPIKVYPKKSLGQNYLTDENICRNIVDSFNILQGDVVIEVGPGKGALTKYLIDKTKNLSVVEIDDNNCKILHEIFPGLNIIHEDFLKINLEEFCKENKVRIIGNIPYNITSEIIFLLVDNRKYIKDAQLMLQEEVAQRIVAKPSCKEYGIPSVLVQAFSKPEMFFNVSKNCFYPKPKIDSRIIHIDFSYSKEAIINDVAFFRKFVRASFSHRRKTLHNSLKSIGIDTNLLTPLITEEGDGGGVIISDFDFGRRAETLSVDEFIYLSNLLCHSRCAKF